MISRIIVCLIPLVPIIFMVAIKVQDPIVKPTKKPFLNMELVMLPPPYYKEKNYDRNVYGKCYSSSFYCAIGFYPYGSPRGLHKPHEIEI